jgi:hypothetical protein
MMHKIREGMPSLDEKYILSGTVEMDEAYFGAPEKGGKRGEGAAKTPVLAALSLNSLDHPQCARLEAVAGVSGEDPRKFAIGSIAPGSTIKSDAFSSYKKLEDPFKVEQVKFGIKANPENLKWLHAVISKAKAFINGTFHGLGDKHLQSCLNEFCYCFNRRKFTGQGFFRLPGACATSKTIIRKVLVA